MTDQVEFEPVGDDAHARTFIVGLLASADLNFHFKMVCLKGVFTLKRNVDNQNADT